MSRRANLSSEPQEHYALNILTGAPKHTCHTAASGSRFPSQEGNRSGPLETNGQSVVDDYDASMLSSQDLDALAFNSAPQNSTQYAYLNETFDSPESQLAMAPHANNLRILNTESYDGRGRSGAHRSMNDMTVLPFGISKHSQIGLDHPLHSSGDQDCGTRGKNVRLENSSQNGEEGSKGKTRGKTRGRPRVNYTDETPADVSTSTYWFAHCCV